jgi:Ricin-type beta-trefoil lectin domain
LGGGFDVFVPKINLEAKDKETSVSKKSIKTKLSLGYTNPKFESDLNEDQKSSILKSLKKWKGELPVDNKFTVTSIGTLKSDTLDETKIYKKKNKNTSNALVVYMWAQTPNLEWDNNIPYDVDDYEEGDPRYIRTQFNVLLKQKKNGNWKASLERDQEAKAEAADLVETDEDAQIFNDLFITDNADNGFTATEEVLIEDAATSSSVSGDINSSSSISFPMVSSNSINSNNSINSSSSNSSEFSKKVTWLESILSFGNVKASAGASEYSWPWKSGDSWQSYQGWHECQNVNSSNSRAGNNFIGEIKGCSLDISQFSTSQSTDLLAPITATVTRSCDDGTQGTMQFKDMSIAHIKSNSLLFNTGAFVRKSTKIGTMFDPGPVNPLDPRWTTTGINIYGLLGTFSSNCGTTSGPHIHIKLKSITNPGRETLNILPENMKFETLAGTMTIDESVLQGQKFTPLRSDNLQNYNPINGSIYNFTSQNTPNTNTFTGKIKSYTNNNLVFDIKDFNGGANAPVQLYTYSPNNTENQQWSYDAVTKQIKGMNGRCLEYIQATSQILMQNCSSFALQQWFFSSNFEIYNASYIIYPGSPAKCIDVGIVSSGEILKASNCNLSNSQKWDASTLGINLGNTNAYSGKIKAYSNTNLIFDIVNSNGNNGAKVQLYAENANNPVNQRWFYDTATRQIKGMNGKCLDASNALGGWLHMEVCLPNLVSGNSNIQSYDFDSQNRINLTGTRLCVESPSGGVTGSILAINYCDMTFPDKQKFNLASIKPNQNIYTGAIKSSTNPNLIFDITNSSAEDGTAIQLSTFPTGYNINQKWKYDPTTKQIKGMNFKCLDMPVSTLVINTCSLANTIATQKWTFDSLGRIKMVNYNICLHAQQGIIVSSVIRGEVCLSDNAQYFNVSEMLGLYNPYIKIIKSSTNSTLLFDVKDYNNGFTDAHIQLANSDSNRFLFQRWEYDTVTKQIKGLNDYCVETGTNNFFSTTGLLLKPCTTQNNQKWTFDNLGRISSVALPNNCISSLSQTNTPTAGSLLMYDTCGTRDDQKYSLMR